MGYTLVKEASYKENGVKNNVSFKCFSHFKEDHKD